MGRNAPLILAIVVGVIAAGLTYSYLKTQQQMTQQLKAVVTKQKQEMNRLQNQIQHLSRRSLVRKKVPVVIAKRDLKAGEILTSDMLEEKYIPAEAKVPAAAGSMDAVIGKQIITDVVKGEQIILSRLVSPKVLQKQLIPPGKRLVTVEVEQTDLFRFIRPGDRVDIAVVLTLPGPYVVSAGLFSDVEIKAINGRISYEAVIRKKTEGIKRRGKSSNGGGIKLNPHKGTLTFALPLRDAAILNMAARFGKIEIYPRSRIDPLKEKIPPVSLDTVLQSALPNLMAKMNLLKQQSLQQQEGKEKKPQEFSLPKPVPVKKSRKIKIRKGSQIEIKEIGKYRDQDKKDKLFGQLNQSNENEKKNFLIERGSPFREESKYNDNERIRGEKNDRYYNVEEGEKVRKKESDPFEGKIPPSLDRYLTNKD